MLIYKKEMGNSKLSMTNWPCHVWLHKKIVWPTNKADLEVSYQLLWYFIMKPYIHREKWCLSVMINVCFEVKRKCIFHWKFHNLSPQCPNDSANSKKTQSLEKSGCTEKCLDNSLQICSKSFSLALIGGYV